MRKSITILLIVMTICVASLATLRSFSESIISSKAGEVIDSLHGVYVYDNGGVNNVWGRNLTTDNYNLGLKYQCVEFVKRYYYNYLHHKMPNAYGNAKDYFDNTIKDGQKNRKRNLIQYVNGSVAKPKESDIIIFSPTYFNKYGHVAIVSKVTNSEVEVIQQNPGLFSGSRDTYSLVNKNGRWTIENNRIYGWLRK